MNGWEYEIGRESTRWKLMHRVPKDGHSGHIRRSQIDFLAKISEVQFNEIKN